MANLKCKILVVNRLVPRLSTNVCSACTLGVTCTGVAEGSGESYQRRRLILLLTLQLLIGLVILVEFQMLRAVVLLVTGQKTGVCFLGVEDSLLKGI